MALQVRNLRGVASSRERLCNATVSVCLSRRAVAAVTCRQVYCWAPAQISFLFFRRHGADEINRGLLFLLYYVCFYQWVNKDEYNNR